MDQLWCVEQVGPITSFEVFPSFVVFPYMQGSLPTKWSLPSKWLVPFDRSDFGGSRQNPQIASKKRTFSMWRLLVTSQDRGMIRNDLACVIWPHGCPAGVTSVPQCPNCGTYFPQCADRINKSLSAFRVFLAHSEDWLQVEPDYIRDMYDCRWNNRRREWWWFWPPKRATLISADGALPSKWFDNLWHDKNRIFQFNQWFGCVFVTGKCRETQ